MNIVAISGRLVADPELRKTGSGRDVATFRVAVDRDYKNSNGERGTDFFSCVLWGNGAPRFCEWKHKGDVVEVTGRIESRTYDAQDGSKRNVVEIIVSNWKGWNTAGAGTATAKQTETYTAVDDDELPF